MHHGKKHHRLGLCTIGLAVLAGAFIHKYMAEYKGEIDRFVKEYGKSLGEDKKS